MATTEEKHRFVVYDRIERTLSTPAILDEALDTFRVWEQQGGSCILYRLVPVEVEITVKVKET